ncbi:hypothetical protein QTP88_014935 [Uroleucon formosanum]
MVVVTAMTTAAAVAEWRRQTDHGRAAVVSTGHGRQRRRRDGETCGGCGHCPVVHPARRIAAMLISCGGVGGARPLLLVAFSFSLTVAVVSLLLGPPLSRSFCPLPSRSSFRQTRYHRSATSDGTWTDGRSVRLPQLCAHAEQLFSLFTAVWGHFAIHSSQSSPCRGKLSFVALRRFLAPVYPSDLQVWRVPDRDNRRDKAHVLRERHFYFTFEIIRVEI